MLVLDWDVHHGNGTEAIFAADPRRALRQHPPVAALSRAPGAAEYTGEGEGEGYTVNLPVPPGAGSDEFLALVEHVVVPIARAYEPGLIAISAGYDAHRDDPLASCTVETEAYGEMTAAIRDVAAELGAPVLVCLEGGYSPSALAASVRRDDRRARGRRTRRAAPRPRRPSRTSRLRERWPLSRLAAATGPAGP